MLKEQLLKRFNIFRNRLAVLFLTLSSIILSMKERRCYLRTVLLSILAAFLIDAVVNFEDYQQGWLVGLKPEKMQETEQTHQPRLPVKIGKVTGMIFSIVF